MSADAKPQGKLPSLSLFTLLIFGRLLLAPINLLFPSWQHRRNLPYGIAFSGLATPAEQEEKESEGKPLHFQCMMGSGHHGGLKAAKELAKANGRGIPQSGW
jgi:hypothetical protein